MSFSTVDKLGALSNGSEHCQILYRGFETGKELDWTVPYFRGHEMPYLVPWRQRFMQTVRLTLVCPGPCFASDTLHGVQVPSRMETRASLA